MEENVLKKREIQVDINFIENEIKVSVKDFRMLEFADRDLKVVNTIGC